MTEDVLPSSACHWLNFPQPLALLQFNTTGVRSWCFLSALIVAQLQQHILFAQYSALQNAAINNYQNELPWATGISTYDINHDGWDDITAATSQHGVAIYLNNHGNFEYIDALENIEGNLKTIYWADYDNDADADLLIIRYTHPILLRNEGNWIFTDVTSALPIAMYSPHMQSACWADYNNDGWLDLYINNYYLNNDITNWLFHNNGDGTFTEVAAIVGVDNGSKPTYQSNWIDYDHDGDQDLYVTNDRDAGNQLYINEGNGYFSPDSSVISNLFMDAMGVQWHDHDYDGDFDLYVSNEIEASVLIENRQGLFVDVTDSLQVGCPNHVSWGVVWTDPENDGLDDLCIVHKDLNNITCHYQRNTDLTYWLNSTSVLSQEPLPSYCLVTGDFNNDGQEDLVQNTVSPQSLLVWIANPSPHNSITIGLRGSESNYDGIGAIIHVHSGGKQRMKQITCGESYYGQASQYEIFGLGEDSIIDSIIVNWPSGWTDQLYSVEPNQNLMIVEGASYSDVPDTINVSRCFNNPVILETGIETAVMWENGDTLSHRIVDSAGIYTCSVPAPFDHTHSIVFNVTDYSPQISYHITPIDCANAASGNIGIAPLPGISSITWADVSDTTLVRTALQAGQYNAQLSFTNGCNITLNFDLVNPPAIETQISYDSICADATASITYSSHGGTGLHFWNWFEQNPNALPSGLHHYLITDEAGCTLSDSLFIHQHPRPELHWSPPFVCENEFAAFAISAQDSVLIAWENYAEEPYVLPAGEHSFSYSYNGECWFDTVYTVLEYPHISLNVIVIDSMNAADIPIFLAEITGGTPPFHYHWTTGDTTVYVQNSDESSIGCTVTDANGCSSEYELWSNSTFEDSFDTIQVYPNPCRNQIHLITQANRSWKIIDSIGKPVMNGIVNQNNETIDISALPNGAYVIQIENDSLTIIKSQ